MFPLASGWCHKRTFVQLISSTLKDTAIHTQSQQCNIKNVINPMYHTVALNKLKSPIPSQNILDNKRSLAELSFIFMRVAYVNDLLMQFVIRVPLKSSRMKLILQLPVIDCRCHTSRAPHPDGCVSCSKKSHQWKQWQSSD